MRNDSFKKKIRKKLAYLLKIIINTLSTFKKSLSWYLKRNPYLKKFVLFPFGSITILTLIAWLFVNSDNKLSSFLNNLVNTLFGIIVTVTFVNFIISKENEKKYKNLQLGIISQIDTLIHKFLWYCLSEFLEPTEEEKYKELLKITPEPYSDWNYRYRYWWRREFVIMKMKELFDRATLKRINEYQQKRDLFMKDLRILKDHNLELIDQEVTKSIEIILKSFTCYMTTDPPEKKPSRDSARWYDPVQRDVYSKFESCLPMMNSLIKWEEEILRFEEKPS